MVQDNELITLVLGIAASIFIYLNIERVRKMPFYKWILGAFNTILIGWTLTVLEGFFLKDILNFLEHTFYVLSALFILIWCFKTGNWIEVKGGSQ